ncbi:hypothetical protein K7I13_10610 [Brucepastera parasyntrophica]|uniref:hypothetical protein n=1 Tax=Brucepastera parasyntrophica TaxID=2880008 RepID=UPI00210AAEBF|nr:hypothetical protein [Brucepastera parasyntrophica]ULQ58967.1 hypothetical protein K7I13_10610 [Brucepastera parasyntrophica]
MACKIRRALLCIMTAAVLMCAACATSGVDRDAPRWMNSPPRSKTKLYAAAAASGEDTAAAIIKAKQNTRNSIFPKAFEITFKTLEGFEKKQQAEIFGLELIVLIAYQSANEILLFVQDEEQYISENGTCYILSFVEYDRIYGIIEEVAVLNQKDGTGTLSDAKKSLLRSSFNEAITN